MRGYLAQAATFLAPRSVDAANGALRQLARWLLASTQHRVGHRDPPRRHRGLQGLAGRPGREQRQPVANTYGQRLRMLRVFFERIIEWDWPDAPPRNPVIGGDIPPRPDRCPGSSTTATRPGSWPRRGPAPIPRDRLVIELLARTGVRAGELADLEADAVVLIGAGHWLRIPLGKLRNDRYVPLHPELVTLLAAWTAANTDHIRASQRPGRRPPRPPGPPPIGRIVAPRRPQLRRHGVHPHQLRHTLATQAINRGMRLKRSPPCSATAPWK